MTSIFLSWSVVMSTKPLKSQLSGPVLKGTSQKGEICQVLVYWAGAAATKASR